MLTPRLKPSRLTSMKRLAVPWNHVAVIHPSPCQAVAKRSQSPASRQTTQFSTTSRIARRSKTISSITSLENIPAFDSQIPNHPIQLPDYPIVQVPDYLSPGSY